MNRSASSSGPASERGDGAELTPIAWEAIPESIRADIGPSLPAGHTVCAVRYPGDRSATEWVWFDEENEVIDVFWYE